MHQTGFLQTKRFFPVSLTFLIDLGRFVNLRDFEKRTFNAVVFFSDDSFEYDVNKLFTLRCKLGYVACKGVHFPCLRLSSYFMQPCFRFEYVDLSIGIYI